ncbi:ABC transporter permease [Candidatus Omnitrophota bacterium]
MNIFSDIIRYKDLLFMLTFRDIKIRYKQAAMGFLWAVFMPIIAILAGLFVKKAIAFVSGRYLEMSDVVTIAVKVLPWTFFISAIKFSVNSLVGNRELVTKIYFPREVFPLAATLACLFDFSVAAVTISILLALVNIGISIYILWLPFFLILLILFTTGLGLFLSAANLFYRDVKYVVEIILMFGIFFTPVFYEAAQFEKYKNLLLLNPMASILEAIYSCVVLHQMPDLFCIFYAFAISIIVFLTGLIIFHKTEPLFAENI